MNRRTVRRTLAGVGAAALLMAAALTVNRGLATPADAQDPAAPVSIERVIDGDTVALADGARVRLIGIDTPELNTNNPDPPECFAQQATDMLAALLAGKTVTAAADPTQDDVDRYDRLLRYLTAGDGDPALIPLEGGRDVALMLLEGGYAAEATFDGAYQRQAQYRQAQARAQAAELGMWNEDVCP
jgi:micrococcal nuclease